MKITDYFISTGFVSETGVNGILPSYSFYSFYFSILRTIYYEQYDQIESQSFPLNYNNLHIFLIVVGYLQTNLDGIDNDSGYCNNNNNNNKTTIQ